MPVTFQWKFCAFIVSTAVSAKACVRPLTISSFAVGSIFAATSPIAISFGVRLSV